MPFRPPWWPENEPWPPAAGAGAWRHGPPGRFVRRMAAAFAALLCLAAVGAASLVSLVVGGHWFRAVLTPLSALAALALVGFALLGLLVAFVRRVGVPFGDIVEASNRVAEGDYSARVAEMGPPSLRAVGRAFNSMTERLQAQDRQRRHLMADIAHELRTPLSVVQGRLEGILDGVYERDDARLGEVLDETRLLARLVEDLRTLAETESGMLALRKEPTDVGHLIRDVADSFSVEADRGRVSIRLETPADLPLLDADPLRIRQVLANLLSNALRHTPAGGVVSIAARPSDGRVVLSVADTGAGIPAADLPKIFDRFYKGDASRGSGLGLTIARNLVRAHGGEIAAESRQGQGTMLTVTLPVG